MLLRPATRSGAATHTRKRQVALQRALKVSRDAAEKRIQKHFNAANSDGDNVLNRVEVRAALTTLGASPALISDAQLNAIITGVTHRPPNEGVTRALMGNLLVLGEAYVRHLTKLEAVFNRFDADGSGQLDTAELGALLSELAGPTRGVSDGDVLWVMDMCDADGDALLSLPELLPALSVWSELQATLPSYGGGTSPAAAPLLLSTGSADEVRARLQSGVTFHEALPALGGDTEDAAPSWRVMDGGGASRYGLDDGGAGVAVRRRLLLRDAQEAADEVTELSAALGDMCRGLVRLVSTPTVTLGAYFLFGVYAYGRLEGWGALDTIYFLMTTTTTVGYGDLAPRTLGGRLFTCAYCLVGITAVMGALLPLANYLLERRHAFEHYVARLLQRVERHEEAAARAVDQTTADDASRQEQQQPSSAAALPGGAGARMLRTRRVLNLVLAAVRLDKGEAAAAQPRVAGAYYAALYAKAMVGPFTIALFGMALSMLLDGTGPIDGFYWSVITMTTIGFGDIAPTSAQGRLAVVLFLPPAVTAMADAVSEVARIATRRRIREAAYAEMSDRVLLEEAKRTGDPNQTLSESGFLIKVMRDHGLVNDAAVAAIHQQFAHVCRHAPRARAEGGGDAAGGELVLTLRLLFDELVRQGRVLHFSSDNLQVVLRQSAEGRMRQQACLVDVHAPDGGFAEWRATYYMPRVLGAMPVGADTAGGGGIGAGKGGGDAKDTAAAATDDNDGDDEDDDGYDDDKAIGEADAERADIIESSKPDSVLAQAASAGKALGTPGQRRATFSSSKRARCFTRVVEVAAAALTELIRLIRLLNSSRIAQVSAFYAFGVVAYRYLEGWSPPDTVYFLTVMSTTVGYGDLSPQTQLGRLFTTFYALAGITCIISAMNPVSRWIVQKVTELQEIAIRRSLARQPPAWPTAAAAGDAPSPSTAAAQSPRRTPRIQRHSTPIREVNRLADYGWDYLTKAMLGPVTAVAVGVGLGVAVLGEGAIDSFYWMIISMTTIGYGDITPATDAARAGTTLFLPIAVATLAHALSQVSLIETTRAIRQTEYATMADELLVEAAVAKGDVDATLSEAEFLLYVLKSHDLIDDATIGVLLDAFSSMMDDGAADDDAQGGSIRGRAGGGSFVGATTATARVFTPEILFRSLVRKGRVVQCKRSKDDIPPGRLPLSGAAQSSQWGLQVAGGAAVSVDLMASDGGFAEWKATQFDAHIVSRAAQDGGGITEADLTV